MNRLQREIEALRSGFDLECNDLLSEEWAAAGDRCPHCTDAQASCGTGCGCCMYYRCVVCRGVRQWDNGGSDAEMCDACWEEHARATGASSTATIGLRLENDNVISASFVAPDDRIRGVDAVEEGDPDV